MFKHQNACGSTFLGVAGLLASAFNSAPVAADNTPRCAESVLEDASLYVVTYATDEDAQVITAGGFEDGILALSIVGPNGSVAFMADFVQRPRIGQADFRFDSTEPTLQRLKRAYPAGRYDFTVTTVGGCTLRQRLKLSYDLLPAPIIEYPLPDATGLPVIGFSAMWRNPAGDFRSCPGRS